MPFAQLWTIFATELKKRRRPDNPDRGFILLVVLWLLLLAGTLGTAIMLSGLRAARTAQQDEARLAGRLALDAAVSDVLYDLVTHGARGRWAMSGQSGIVSVDSISVSVTVTNEAGRLDLNSAPFEAIDPVLEAAGLPDRERVSLLAAMDERRNATEPMERRYSNFSEIAALPGMTGDALACLLPLTTLYTGRSEPAPQWAPHRLRDILLLEPPAETLPEEDRLVTVGNVYRIEARLDGASARLARTVIVRITGNMRKPVWVYPAVTPETFGECQAE